MNSKSIKILEGVEANVDGSKINIKGPKGELEKDFHNPIFNALKIKTDDSNVIAESEDGRKKMKAMIGTVIAHIRNMMDGVTKGYKYTMKIHFSHFPMAVESKDGKVMIKNFLGEKGYRIAEIFGNVDIKISKEEVILTGINKEDLGQTALNIENACHIIKKDIRIINDGIYPFLKEFGDSDE